MSRPTAARPLRLRGSSGHRASRRGIVRLQLEILETRQLLSVSVPDLNQIMAQPAVTATPLVSSPVPTGLSPAQVRQAYAVNQISFKGGTVTGDGSGQTIAIVVAYDDPNISSDLKQFDRQYGLVDPPSFTKYIQTGLNQTDAGWSLETSLDVEWAHAIAPKANIVLVEARTASFYDLFGAVNFARSINGVGAVSMSWGSGEFYGETAYDSLFTTPAGHLGSNGQPGGVTFVAASGDSGAWSGVSYPATSPNVLSVGATTLNLGSGSSYAGERGWTGSTGGFSALEAAPAYQAGTQAATGLNYGLRTTPDLAMVGDPASGVSVYSTVPYGGKTGWYAVGGTSASAPQVAGLIAITDQGLALAGKGSIGNAQAALYSLPSSAFHDVSQGFNGYSSTTGYDLVTGLGSPIGNRLVAGLLATQGVYNVTGFPSPTLGRSLQALPAQITVVFDPNAPSGSSAGGGSSGGSARSTNVSPIVVGNVVIIVVPVGSTQVLVVLPLAGASGFAVASSNHPVQAPVATPNPLAGSSATTLSRFGQDVANYGPTARSPRFSAEGEFAALIDIVEPFQPAPPAGRPQPLAPAREALGVALTPSGNPRFTPWMDLRCAGLLPRPGRPGTGTRAGVGRTRAGFRS